MNYLMNQDVFFIQNNFGFCFFVNRFNESPNQSNRLVSNFSNSVNSAKLFKKLLTKLI